MSIAFLRTDPQLDPFRKYFKYIKTNKSQIIEVDNDIKNSELCKKD
jgi:hypothetical protein